MTQGAVGKQIMQIVEKAGEIRTPADMAGLKFRVVGSTLGIVDPLASFIHDAGIGSTGAMALVVIVLLGIGMVLDGVSIFLIFVPLLTPLMKTFGWDPVWFGLILTYMVAIGQFTPPIAVNLMVSARLAGVRMEDTVRWVVWFVLAMLLLLVALIAFPQISLWLPRTLGY